METTISGLGFRISPIMGNQVEKQMEHEWKLDLYSGL